MQSDYIYPLVCKCGELHLLDPAYLIKVPRKMIYQTAATATDGIDPLNGPELDK